MKRLTLRSRRQQGPVSAHRSAGFTLLELLIASVLSSIVIAGALYLLVQQNRTYAVIEQTSETQLNLRAIAQIIANDLRHTGLLVPEAAALCGLDTTATTPGDVDADPDELYVTDAEAINAQAMTSIVGAVSNIRGSFSMTASATTGGLQTLTVSNRILDNNPFYFVPTPGATPFVANSDFQVGHAAILVNLAQPANGTACGPITAIIGNQITVDFINRIAVGAANQAFLVPAHRYRVDPVTTTLFRDNLPLATNITDFQFAVFFDANNDFVQDPGELLGSGVPTPPTPHYVSVGSSAVPRNHRLVRSVRFNLVGETTTAVETNVTGTTAFTEFHYPENRLTPSNPTLDGLRRRLYTSTVQLRNIGNRGTLRPIGG